jgi:D-sedoheptulose 7-phosphate isomerase
MSKEDNMFLKKRLNESLKVAVECFDYTLAVELAKRVFGMRGTSQKLIFIGNGASNTIANHAALDYMGQTGVTAIAVNDAAVLTAFSNDFGYDGVFERYVKINCKPGDVLVAVSSSGNSPNVVNAVRCAQEMGNDVYCFSGFNVDNALYEMCDKTFWVDSDKYNVVESVHNLWLAMICDLLIDWMGDGVGVHGIEV